jgi:hypothetical protein
MATKQAPKEKQTPAQPKQQAPAQAKQQAALAPLLFDKSNYVFMIAGLVVVLLGFALMSGGATTDPNVFPKDEIYSFRRITLAPIVVIIGFGIELFAILKSPNN